MRALCICAHFPNKNRYGNYVLQQTLAVAKEPQHSSLLDAVRPHVHQVRFFSFVSFFVNVHVFNK